MVAVRAAPTTNNAGPYTCVAFAYGGCEDGSVGFSTTFMAKGDTY